jgi:hypothetical protein
MYITIKYISMCQKWKDENELEKLHRLWASLQRMSSRRTSDVRNWSLDSVAFSAYTSSPLGNPLTDEQRK